MLVEQGEVVAVEGDVQRAHGQLRPLLLRDQRADALRQRHAPALDADEHQVLRALIALDDLVRDALDGAAHRRLVHDLCLSAKFHGCSSFAERKK